MPLKKRGAALTAATAALAIALAGCHGQQTGTSSTPQDDTASVAVVNDQQITQNDFYNQLQTFQPSPQQQSPEPVGRTVLRTIIEAALIEQLAKKNNASPTDAEVQGVLAGEKAIVDFQTVEGFDKQLQDAGLTEDDMKSRQLLPTLCRVKMLSNGVTVSDSDIQQYYDKNKAQRFSLPDRVHIRKIALSTQMEAQTIAAAIKAGKPFDNYLSQSMDQSTPTGDVPRWIPLSGTITPDVKPLVNALKNVNPGQIADPINFGGSWWIVEVADKKSASVLPLDQIKDLVRFQILSDKVQSNFSSNMDFEQKLRQFSSDPTTVITTSIPAYQSLVAQIKNPPPAPSIPQMAPPSAVPGAPRPTMVVPGSPVKPGAKH